MGKGGEVGEVGSISRSALLSEDYLFRMVRRSKLRQLRGAKTRKEEGERKKGNARIRIGRGGEETPHWLDGP